MITMRKFLFWFFGVAFVVGIVSAVLSDPATNTNTGPKAQPNATEIKRQRVAADKAAEAEFQRMDKLDQNAFCIKELTKLRNPKLSKLVAEAIELQALRFFVMPDQIESVKEKTVRVGLSSCTALAAWGRPERINTSEGANYSQEQWVYGNGHYLYIKNNIVTSMQTSK